MKAIVQRVSSASVVVEGNTVANIEHGLLIYLGITHDDSYDEIDYLVKKILGIRIFNDIQGKMNLSCTDLKLPLLVVSQFTLYADTRKGNRPSYMAAARPEIAKDLYDKFLETLSRKHNADIKSGIFQAHMEITSVNDGPVTIELNSH